MSTDTGVLTVTVDGQTLTFAPGKTVTFGRTLESDVTINHPLVSRTHAVASVTPTGWVLTDRSTNGVFVAGVRRPMVALNGTQSVMFGDPRTGAAVAISVNGRPPAPSNPAVPSNQPPASGRFPQQPPQGPPPRRNPSGPPSNPSGSASTPNTPQRPAGSGQQRPAAPSAPRPLPPRQQSAPLSRPAAPQPAPPAPQSRPVSAAADLAPHLRAMAGNTGLFQAAPIPAPRAGSGELSIGRTPDNDLVIPDMLVSRRHARLLTGAQGLVIEDLHSANGDRKSVV